MKLHQNRKTQPHGVAVGAVGAVGVDVGTAVGHMTCRADLAVGWG